MAKPYALLIILTIFLSIFSVGGIIAGSNSSPPSKTSFTTVPLPIHIATRSLAPELSIPPILMEKIWTRGMGDGGAAIANDSAGNIYVTGYSVGQVGSYYPSQGILLKYNSTGDLVWQRAWSSPPYYPSGGYGIVVATSGNIYVTGYTQFSNGTQILVMKFDSTGTLVWQKGLAGTVGYSNNYGVGVSIDSQESVYISGYTSPSYPYTPKMMLIKLNSTGSLQWQLTCCGTNYGYGYGSAIDASDNIYVAGYANGPGFQNAMLLKFNSTGNLLWQRAWGGAGFSGALDVAVDQSGNAYLTGSAYEYASNGTGYRTFLLKFDPSGNLLWQKEVGVPNLYYSVGSGVITDSLGDVYVTGYMGNFYSSYSLLMLKFDSTGTLLRQATVGDRGLTTAQGHPIVDSAGNVIAVGQVNSAPPYLVCPLNGVTQVPSFSVSTPNNNTLASPNLSISTTAEGVLNVSGSQTYSTGSAALLLKIGNGSSSTTQRPCLPGSLMATSTSNSVSLTWSPPNYNGGSAITGYRVYRSGGGPGNVTQIASLGNQTSYTDTTVTGGIGYTYLVTAVNAIGESGFSNAAFAYIPPTVSSQPLYLNVTAGIGQETLRWTTPINTGGSPITGYRVYRGQSPGTEAFLTTLPLVNSFVDVNVVKGVKYYYYITAINGLGESAPSNEASSSAMLPAFPSLTADLVLAATIATAVLLIRSHRKRRLAKGFGTLPEVLT